MIKSLIILLLLSSVVYADVPNGLYTGEITPKVMPPKDKTCSDPDMGLKVWRLLRLHVSSEHVQDQRFDEMDTHADRRKESTISGGFSYTEAIDGKLVEITNMVIRYVSSSENGMSLVISTKQ